MRAQLIKFRTMQIYQLRGPLCEYGVTSRTGRQAGLAECQIEWLTLRVARPGQLDEGIPHSCYERVAVKMPQTMPKAAQKPTPSRDIPGAGRDA